MFEEPMPEQPMPDIPEEPGDVNERTPASRKHLVKRWTAAVDQAKEHWSKQFDQMRKDERFARGDQWPSDPDGDKYVANITMRHVQQRVSDLYARNPRVVARQADRMQYEHWDGKAETLQAAQQILQAAQEGQMDPSMAMTAQLIIQDAMQGQQKSRMLSKVGETMERVFAHQMLEQPIPFKQQMKNMVRRAVTTGVGYVQLGFQRQVGMSPEVEARIKDVRDRLARIERLGRELAEGDHDGDSAQAGELEAQIAELQNQPEVVLREGLIFDFPRSTEIIPDPKCTNVVGFLGCDWVAREYRLTTAQIEEIYGVDVGDDYDSEAGSKNNHRSGSVIEMSRAFANAERGATKEDDTAPFASVYEIWSKGDGLVYVVCAGYPDFLVEPHAPEVALDRFWPVFTYALNPLDCEDNPYPPSDVTLIRHQQMEINRARQGLREHRLAARPKIVTSAGQLSESDRDMLQSVPEDGMPVLELQALQPNQKVADLLQPFNPPGVDPNLYDVGQSYQDVMRTVGTQEANLGGTSKSTATESNIAEQSRQQASTSAVDDLDELLSELSRSAGQVLLAEMSSETVHEIAGRGAVWPELSNSDISRELYLEIEAGSTGRPNQAVELQAAERLVPLLMQIPGISPEWLAKEVLRRMDDNLRIEDAFAPGMPAIQTLNQQLVQQMRAGEGGQGPAPGSQPQQAAAGQAQGGDPAGVIQEAAGGPQDQMQPGPANTVPGQELAIR